MVGIDSSNNPFVNAAGAAGEVWKILKKEEQKGKKSKIMGAIRDFHLAHEAVKEELAQALSEETGMNVQANSELVDNVVFSLSLGKIFENREGEIGLAPDLKSALQHFDSESQQAKEAVASKLSEGSKQRVPSNDNLINRDIDEIAIRTVENPDLLL
jgi:hypothetical protein